MPANRLPRPEVQASKRLLACLKGRSERQENMKHDRLCRWAYVVVALALTAGSISAAGAQMPGYNGYNQSQRVWGRRDACKRQAWKQHPDYTREDTVKRDEAVRRCLAANNAPPAEPRTPPVPQERSGSSR